MATAYVTTARPSIGGAHERLRANAAQDRFGAHALVADPDEADLILFTDDWQAKPFYDRVRRHPLVQRCREKCFCISEVDHGFPFLPGVYADCRARWYRPDRVRSGFYLSKFENPHVGYAPLPGRAPHLFSFVGSADTHAVRTRVLGLRHPRALLMDTSAVAYRVRWEGTAQEKDAFYRQYAEALAQSRFVLCPRGRALSSRRLFDVMQTGRAPVIIADEWVPPEGPDWDACSLRVPEDAVERIPALLERRADEAAAMGAAARRAWETWFAPDACFHRIVEWCLDIRACRAQSERWLRWAALPHLATAPYRRAYAASRWRLLRDEGRLAF